MNCHCCGTPALHENQFTKGPSGDERSVELCMCDNWRCRPGNAHECQYERKVKSELLQQRRGRTTRQPRAFWAWLMWQQLCCKADLRAILTWCIYIFFPSVTSKGLEITMNSHLALWLHILYLLLVSFINKGKKGLMRLMRLERFGGKSDGSQCRGRRRRFLDLNRALQWMY